MKVYNQDESNTIKTQALTKLASSTIDLSPEITDNVTGETKPLEVVENQTRPVYDLKNIETGEIVTQYKTEFSVQATGTYSDNGSDSTSSVTAYGTLYYTYNTVNSETYVGMDKIDWRYTINDNLTTIKSKSHEIYQYGVSQNSGPVTQKKNLNPTANSGTDLVRNWGWASVISVGSLYKTGIEMKATLSRTNNPSYTWTMTVPVFQVGIV